MKIRIGFLTCFGLVISLFVFSGCYELPRSYRGLYWLHAGISPIYPDMNYGYIDRYKTIGTLSPELKWKDLKKSNQTYDVGIWETPYRSIDDIKKKADQGETSWGFLVYSTNSIPTNYFQIPICLKPNTYYNWSVRIRDGEKVGHWSSFVQQKAVFSEVYTYSDIPFGFKTPAP